MLRCSRTTTSTRASGKHLDEPVRDLLAVVAARERVAGEALEGDDRREALVDESLHERLELRAALLRVELERPRADESPHRVLGARLVDPAEAGLRIAEEEEPEPAAAGLVVADVQEDRRHRGRIGQRRSVVHSSSGRTAPRN